MPAENLPEEVVKKIPTFEDFKKNQRAAVSYIFMLFFVGYFFYKEVMSKDDCGEKVAAFERVILQKDEMIQSLNKRVEKLETAFDTQNGVVERVKTTVENVGGSK